MDANDDVIGLLNDIGAGKVKDEIFMDRNGEPTDLFFRHSSQNSHAVKLLARPTLASMEKSL